jgi:D-alanyl-D-alanine carboxypeptidase (penicillin-binding protein 5/6)
MDSQSGQILYAHEPDLPAQPASTIKILTGLIAMKSLGDSTRVEISRKASKMPRSKIYLHQGRQYKADDLINAVLISSANDASVALAEKVAGSEQIFVKLMNHKARELGARSTLCKTASGLTVRGQHSTVRDLALIFNGAMADEEFAHRISKVRARTSYGRLLSNHNRALWRIDGAMGGKTGYTHSARQTYVGMFERDGKAITVAIMGSETMWDDISTMVEYGFVRRTQLVALGKLDQEPALVASLDNLSDDQGSTAEDDDAVFSYPVLSQTSKHR